MRAVRCLIVDDDDHFRGAFRAMLKPFGHINVVGEATRVSEARELMDRADPDLIFLDVELGMETGFSLIADAHRSPMVIVVSGSEEHAIKAFELRALDYLVKPFSRERLKDALSRLRLCSVGGTRSPHCRAMSALLRADDVALIEDSGTRHLMPVRSLLWIQADGNYTQVCSADGSDHHLVRRSCDEWMHMLPEELFAQLDRSLIVNIPQVTGWRHEGRNVRLQFGGCKREVLVGRAAAGRFKKRMAVDLQA